MKRTRGYHYICGKTWWSESPSLKRHSLSLMTFRRCHTCILRTERARDVYSTQVRWFTLKNLTYVSLYSHDIMHTGRGDTILRCLRITHFSALKAPNRIFASVSWVRAKLMGWSSFLCKLQNLPVLAPWAYTSWVTYGEDRWTGQCEARISWNFSRFLSRIQWRCTAVGKKEHVRIRSHPLRLVQTYDGNKLSIWLSTVHNTVHSYEPSQRPQCQGLIFCSS